MTYSQNALENINEKYQKLALDHKTLFNDLMSFQNELKNEKAKEYLTQGAGRRITILFRCIQNIFSTFPVERTEHLSRNERNDIEINLHAFFINIVGLFDNLAWVFVHEKELFGRIKDGKLSKTQVGLFLPKTQNHFSQNFKDHLNSDRMSTWHKKYSKNYRDALAHRIPLYVPPSLLNDKEAEEYQSIENRIHNLDSSKECDRNMYDELYEKQKNLGRISHLITHSLNEESPPVYFHAQVLADYATVEETFVNFRENFNCEDHQ